MRQILSISQMRELEQMGIDTSSASACWYPDNDPDYPDNPLYLATFAENVGDNYPGRVPAFTLQDILEMLPACVGDSHLHVQTAIGCISYEDPRIKVCWWEGNILTAAVNMLKWCAENTNEISKTT